MTETEKMLAGLFYDPADPALTEKRSGAKKRCDALNQSGDESTRKAAMNALFGRETNAEIVPPFFCDYGENITLADDVFINCNCVFLDCAEIVVKEGVKIGPSCGLYTAIHPKEAVLRRGGAERAKPIVLEEDVWLGGSVTVLPGVTIGRGAVIGGGSVVTKDIPPNVMAAGNPCKVIRPINQSESEEPNND